MKTKEEVFELDNNKRFNAVTDFSEKDSKYHAIIAHGANNDMNNVFLRILSKTLCDCGISVTRFNFPYRFENRKSPDASKTLKKAWIKIFEYINDRKESSVICIGKSMGGRICGELCSEKIIDPDGLVFLGYPLHAPGKMDSLKDESLYRLELPVIFISGTSDPLCNRELLEKVNGKMASDSKIYFIERAGHSLALKGMGEKETKEHYRNLSVKIKDLIKE